MAKPSKAERELIDQAIKRLKIAVDADNHNREAAIDDLKFANGDQWNQNEKKRRSDKGRPALTLNFLPKYVDQVVGDMLHNTPSIKIRPEDSRADVNIAKIRQGIISNIEYSSNSKGIYGYGAKQQVTCGYGGWRVLTRYTEENPFLQEIYLEGIRNPFLIYLDPTAKDQNYADAKWGLLLEKIPCKEFEDRYPKATVPSSNSFKTGKGLADELWYDGDNITVAEYFTKETETVTMLQLEDGRVVTQDEFDELHDEWEEKFNDVLAQIELGKPPMGAGPIPPMPSMAPPTPPAPNVPAAAPPSLPPVGSPPQAGTAPPMPVGDVKPEPKIAQKRDTERTIIKHRIITAMEILDGGKDGNIFPGKYIPLVLLKGKELNIEGKNFVYSLIRHAKDPQKLINYWNTAAAETIALAPKAPWLATPKQIEGHEEAYATANVENYPVILYNVDSEAPGPPQRQQPGQPPVAMFEQIRRGEENLKSVIGLFNADVGGPTSQQTGEAVRAVQKPGDVGTFEFTENLARAIMYTGRIINEMIPEVYDSERDVRIRNIDESESFVPINTTVGAAMNSVKDNPDRFQGMDANKLHSLFAKEGKDAKFNDVTAGKYSVVVTTGPSYSTQRQESAQHLLQLVQAMPQQMGVAADLIVENMDFKAADELAARLRKALPPNIAKPRPGEAPPAPPQPPPQVLLAQAKVETEKIKAQTLQAKAQLEMAKAQKEMGQGTQTPPPEPPDPNAQANAVVAQMKVQMEQMKMQHEQTRLALEKEMEQQRAQLERSRLQFEVQRQQLVLQQQREAHQAKLETMELANEKTRAEIKAKKAPPKRDK